MWVDPRRYRLKGCLVPVTQCCLCFHYRRWMPICCVRFAPSTFMTSVQQWLDLVSSLEGLLCCRFPRAIILSSSPASAPSSQLIL